MDRAWTTWVAVVVVVAAGTLVVDRATLGATASALARSPLPLLGALAAYTLAFVLRAAAWGALLPGHVAVPLGRRVRALFAMLAVNHALPGPVGELARARVVATPTSSPRLFCNFLRNTQEIAEKSAAPPSPSPEVTFRQALLSVVAARVVDVGAIAVLLVAGAVAAGSALPGWARVAAPVGVVLPFGALWVARRRGASLTWRAGARSMAWAVPSWGLECFVLVAVAQAAGVEVSLAGAVLATCAGVLAQVAAVLPGGVGTYEAGVTSALVVLGVPADVALAVAASTHVVKFAYAFAVGVPALTSVDFSAIHCVLRSELQKSRVGVG